ncbi:hypothetical protein UT300012_22890 [Paraclostridium bifermentans]
MDNELTKYVTKDKFEEFDKVVRGLHRVNLYQNPIVLGKEEHFEFKNNLDYYRDKVNKLFDEVEQFAKSISLEGKDRHLVSYALKLMDKANDCAESGCPEEANVYAYYHDDIARFLSGDSKKLGPDTLSDYEQFMGKAYVRYPRTIHVPPCKAKDMYGNYLNDPQYKKVIDNTFSLISDLVVHDAIDTVIVHNDYGLSIMVMIAIRLLKKDGYEIKVVRVEDLDYEVSNKQIDIDRRLRDVISSIVMKDEGGYDTELIYTGLGEVALRDAKHIRED